MKYSLECNNWNTPAKINWIFMKKIVKYIVIGTCIKTLCFTVFLYTVWVKNIVQNFLCNLIFARGKYNKSYLISTVLSGRKIIAVWNFYSRWLFVALHSAFQASMTMRQASRLRCFLSERLKFECYFFLLAPCNFIIL